VIAWHMLVMHVAPYFLPSFLLASLLADKRHHFHHDYDVLSCLVASSTWAFTQGMR